MATKRVPIEVDITYVNKTWFTPKKRSGESKEKNFVIGFFQRETEQGAIIRVLENDKPETIEKIVSECVAKGAMLYAEENILPASLKEIYEVHEIRQNVGEMHVNNVKNMWKDLKRDLKRTHISVSRKHLQSYCDQVVWFVNTRHLSQADKFNTLLSLGVKTRKTTYQDLIK